MKFIVQGELTDLNKYIKAERSNRFIAASIKKEETERVHWESRSQKLSLEEGGRFYIFKWVTRNERIDSDNTAFACKFILDGLVSAGIIDNDSRKDVLGMFHMYGVDKTNPHIEVTTWSSLPKALKYLSTL